MALDVFDHPPRRYIDIPYPVQWAVEGLALVVVADLSMSADEEQRTILQSALWTDVDSQLSHHHLKVG